MNARRPVLSLELLLYLLILGLAAWLRIGRLGWLPLTDAEARHALSAAEQAGLASPYAEADPPVSAAYHAFTAAIFSLFGTADSAARWISAAAGLAMVFAPALLRREIGPSRALIACGLLAISPVAVAASRQAGGGAVAALGLVAALFVMRGGLQSTGRIVIAGAGVGLAAAAGPELFTGLVGLAVALLIHRLLHREVRIPEFLRLETAAISGGAALLLISTGGGFIPSGIAAVFDSLATWLSGWTEPGLPALSWLIGIWVYEPLILIFGLIGAGLTLARARSYARAPVSWAAGALLIALFYTGRGMSDAVWLVVPLVLLASDVIARGIESFESRLTLMTAAFAFLFLAFFTFSYLQLSHFAAGASGVGGQPPLGRYLGFATAAVLIVGIGAVVLAAYFSARVAGSALFLSGGLALLGLTVSAGLRLNFGTSAFSARELWRPQSPSREALAMVEAYQTLSQAATGRAESLPLSVQGNPSPGLAWLVRAAEPYSQSAEPAPVILAPELLEGPFLRAEYVGQSLALSERWGWDGWAPPELMRWLITREAPVLEERWILYARADIAGLGEADPQVESE